MDEFYTINQTAIILKVHSLTVRRYVKEGKLKAYRVGGNVRISINDLRNFMQNFVSQPKQVKQQSGNQIKEFSYHDPILSLRGKGLSISKAGLE